MCRVVSRWADILPDEEVARIRRLTQRLEVGVVCQVRASTDFREEESVC